jgi:hypothetical protein
MNVLHQGDWVLITETLVCDEDVTISSDRV